MALCALLPSLFAACSSSGGGGSGPTSASQDAPRIVAVDWIDVDQNGADEDDVLMLQFDREVILQGNEVVGVAAVSDGDSLGDGPWQQQSLPGSDRVELFLGQAPVLTAGVPGVSEGSEINVLRVEGPPRIEGVNGFLATASRRSLPVLDRSGEAPVLVDVRFVDADNDRVLGPGDRVVVGFDQPIVVPLGTTPEINFALPVAGDTFGTGARLVAASSSSANRAVFVELGLDPVLRVDGEFSAAAGAPGAPSAVTVAPGTLLTNSVLGAPVPALVGVTVDLGEAESTFFGNGRNAEDVLGGDAFEAALSAQGLRDVAAMATFVGTLTVDGVGVDVRLLFVADRGNNRVLIFEDAPAGSFPSASWVLGQPDFSTALAKDPANGGAIPASPTNLLQPEAVAFDAATLRLFVADTGHHRVLVWDQLFRLAPGGTGLALENGRSASFVLGQSSFTESRPNRGSGAPTASSFSSPRGLSLDAGRLAVADTNNHRVVLYSSLPTSSASFPSTVLGQTEFTSGTANRGGLPGANTLDAPTDVFVSTSFVVGAVPPGQVIVVDSGNHRVLTFSLTTLVSGQDANVVLGQPDATTAAEGLSATELDTPLGVVGSAASQQLFVADAGNHRVMIYDATALVTGQAGVALGQVDASSGEPNRGGPPGAETLQAPARVAVSEAVLPGSDTFLLVSDTGNHRIPVYGGVALPVAHEDAVAVIGQRNLDASGPSGRLLNRPGDVLMVGGRLVISDTLNHRVLLYDGLPLTVDAPADLVLGQTDLFGTAPNGGEAVPSAATFDGPVGLATDGVRLAVADRGNHRILVWETLPTTDGQAADFVIGQAGPDARLPNAGGAVGANTLDTPLGMAFGDGALLVADRGNHRVLIFGDFAALSGFDDADVVVGQQDFNRREPNRGEFVSRSGLSEPEDVLVGGSRLYVADTGNHRVLVWRRVPSGSGRGADGVLGQSRFEAALANAPAPNTLLRPNGLAADAETSLLFVSDSGHHRVVVYEDVRESVDGREARAALGQAQLSLGAPNQGLEGPSFATLQSPQGIFFNGYELLVSDLGNSRVVVYR